MKIVSLPITGITPYHQNPRDNRGAITKVAASIKEFGFRQPIVVDGDLVVIAGHTRLLAAKELGLEEIPVHIADGLSPAQAAAYRLADNRLHEYSAWDEELLKLELAELKEADFDLTLTGFDNNELSRLLKEEINGIDEADDTLEPPSTPVCRLGDLWLLGEHRLFVGDACFADSYRTLLDGKKADLVFTDPPYNVNYSGTLKDRASNGGQKQQILNDNLQDGFYEFLHAVSLNLIANSSGAIYICMAASNLDVLRRAFIDAGGYWSTYLIWAKNHFTMGGSDYQRQYEPILYGWGQKSKRYWCGARNIGDVWFINKPNSNDLHPMMKPVELISRAIENSSQVGSIVLDPFAGSGSTLIACEQTGRVARAMELEPKYCDVIIARWENMTGKHATLASTREAFEAVKIARAENCN